MVELRNDRARVDRRISSYLVAVAIACGLVGVASDALVRNLAPQVAVEVAFYRGRHRPHGPFVADALGFGTEDPWGRPFFHPAAENGVLRFSLMSAADLLPYSPGPNGTPEGGAGDDLRVHDRLPIRLRPLVWNPLIGWAALAAGLAGWLLRRTRSQSPLRHAFALAGVLAAAGSLVVLEFLGLLVRNQVAAALSLCHSLLEFPPVRALGLPAYVFGSAFVFLFASVLATLQLVQGSRWRSSTGTAPASPTPADHR